MKFKFTLGSFWFKYFPLFQIQIFGILIASYCILEYCKIPLCDLLVPSPLISHECYLENKEEGAIGHCFLSKFIQKGTSSVFEKLLKLDQVSRKLNKLNLQEKIGYVFHLYWVVQFCDDSVRRKTVGNREHEICF